MLTDQEEVIVFQVDSAAGRLVPSIQSWIWLVLGYEWTLVSVGKLAVTDHLLGRTARSTWDHRPSGGLHT
jgi:hypothetical protein